MVTKLKTVLSFGRSLEFRENSRLVYEYKKRGAAALQRARPPGMLALLCAVLSVHMGKMDAALRDAQSGLRLRQLLIAIRRCRSGSASRYTYCDY